jgi:hypothetical protein
VKSTSLRPGLFCRATTHPMSARFLGSSFALRYSSPSGPIADTCVTYSPDFVQWNWDVLPGRTMTFPGGYASSFSGGVYTNGERPSPFPAEPRHADDGRLHNDNVVHITDGRNYERIRFHTFRGLVEKFDVVESKGFPVWLLVLQSQPAIHAVRVDVWSVS